MKLIFVTALTMMMVGMAKSTCDHSVDLLMVTYEKGTSFEGQEYKVQATSDGNLQVIKKSNNDVIYDNKCYCNEGNCPGEFEVKLQTDANIFVNPKGGQNHQKVWKNNKPGNEGVYALVVKNGEPQVLKFEGTRSCPKYGDKMWCPPMGGVCYGADTKPETPVCDTSNDKAILMTTNDRGNYFKSHILDSELFVEETGNLILKWGGSSTMFESDCECQNSRRNRQLLRELTPATYSCDYTYEAKLQEDGNLIVLPQGQDNTKKIWKSQEVGPKAEYALVDNYNLSSGECLQVWRFNGDKDCPIFYEKVWDCSDCSWCKGDDDFCYT